MGFRDEEGILRAHQEFATQEIPQMYVSLLRLATLVVDQTCRIGSLPNPPWNPAHSLHFLHGVLSLLRTHVLPTDPTPREPLGETDPLPPAQVWRFSFVPRQGCELWHVGEIGLENGRWGGVLSEEYVRWRMSR